MKERAANCRTLQLTDEEIPCLKSALLHSNDVIEDILPSDKIVCADTMEILSRLPDGFAELIIVDPPYNLSRNFGMVNFHAMKTEKYEEYLRSWIPELCKKLKDNGSMYVCGDWKCTPSLQKVLSEHLTVINRITWQREKGRGANNNWKNSMEDILFAVKNPKDYYFDVDAVKQRRTVLAPYKVNGKPKDWETTEEDGKVRLTCPSNFWDDISVPFWSMPENTDHPTQKPEKLIAKLILASSKSGDTVFDPFLGSGTTAVVAKKLGRHFLGIEMNEEFCLCAQKRLFIADTKKDIQGYEDGVFWERNAKRRKQNHTFPNDLTAKD